MSSDPIEDVITTIKRIPGLREAHLTASFLNKAGDVYERYGAAAAGRYLAIQEGRERREAALLQRVLPALSGCPQIRANPAIGRLIIKSLNRLFEGGEHATAKPSGA
ncbi:MAG: hypothetical protein ACRD2O_04195 [Terriglobia bacterium]